MTTTGDGADKQRQFAASAERPSLVFVVVADSVEGSSATVLARPTAGRIAVASASMRVRCGLEVAGRGISSVWSARELVPPARLARTSRWFALVSIERL